MHWATAEANPFSDFLALATEEANPLSAFLTLGYSRGESPFSFPGTGLQHRHKLRFPLSKDPALSKVLSFNSGEGQNQTLRVSPAARNSILLISVSRCIRLFPNPPSIFSLHCGVLQTHCRESRAFKGSVLH